MNADEIKALPIDCRSWKPFGKISERRFDRLEFTHEQKDLMDRRRANSFTDSFGDNSHHLLAPPLLPTEKVREIGFAFHLQPLRNPFQCVVSCRRLKAVFTCCVYA